MDWLVYVRKKRMEVQLQDPKTSISDDGLASKMLRGSGLSQKVKAQVFFNCGGVYDSKRMETVMKATYGKLHDSERRSYMTPNMRSKIEKFGAIHSSRSSTSRTQSSAGSRTGIRNSKFMSQSRSYPLHKVHEVGEVEELEAEPEQEDIGSTCPDEEVEEGLSRLCERLENVLSSPANTDQDGMALPDLSSRF